MSARGPRRLATVLVTAPLLCAALVAALLPDHLLNLVCRSGVLMDVDACCPSQGAEGARAGEPRRPAAWRDEACCSVRALDLDRVSPARPEVAASFVPVVAVLAAPRPAFAPPERFLVRWSVSPPPLGPPLVLLKSSFLL